MNNKWKEVNESINKIFDIEIEGIQKYPMTINEISKDPIGFISHLRTNLIAELSKILNKE